MRPLIGLLLSIPLLVPVAAHAARPAAKILPAESADLRWEGDTAIYPGDFLFDYINGGAPQYIEYGFIEVASQELVYREHTYIFDVYRMATPLAAFGIFSGRRPAVAPLIGRLPYSSFTAYQGLAAYGPYLFDITAYESSETTAREMNDLLLLAIGQGEIAESADDLTLQPPFSWLPRDGRHPGTEKLARGPVSLRAALGRDAKGTFYAAIDEAQLELAREEVLRGEQVASAAGGASPAEETPSPYWVIAGYHPQTGAENNLETRTRMVLLVNHGRYALAGGTTHLRAAAAVAIGEAEGAWDVAQAPDQTLCWSDRDGTHGCLLALETHLAFVASRLERESFRDWIAGLGKP
jgi:hypothetical protein